MYIKKYINCIAAEIAGGLIGAGGSLIGSSIGAISQYYTNQTNKEIAESNNKAMLDAMREQTKADQDYNSMSAQMQRAMIAGLNPMTLAGSQPTSVSASGVPSLDTPIMQNPFGELNLGMDQLGSAMIQSAQLDLQRDSVDISDFKSKIDMLKTVGDLLKDSELTTNDVNNLVSSIFGKEDPNHKTFESVFRDRYVTTRLNNAIESSNLSLEEKKYLIGWLDERINAEYTNLLADTELKQTTSLRNRSQLKVDQSIASMNDAKRREYEQAIKNMQEEWKSLNLKGTIDAANLKKAVSMADDIARKYHYDAGVSELDFKNYIFNKYISSSGNFGGIFATMFGTGEGVALPDYNY